MVFARLGLALSLVIASSASLAGSSAPLVAPDAGWRAVMPAATAIGPAEGSPPAAPAYRDGALIGYVVSTKDAIDARGYAGKPLDILVGVSLDAHITGAWIRAQDEPILTTGVRPEDLDAFASGFAGRDLRDAVQVVRDVGGADQIDAISGATISSVVIGDVIMRAARAVAQSRGLLGEAAGDIDYEGGGEASWQELVDDGSIAVLADSVGQAAEAIDRQGGRLYPPGAAPPADAAFIDLDIGHATPVRIGRSLLGDQLYNRLTGDLDIGGELIFVAARGAYSFKGTSYVRDGVFDRFQIVQGERTFRLGKEDHIRIEKLALADAPDLRELAMFRLDREDGFQPAAPWRFELLVMPPGKSGSAAARFVLPYQLPERYLKPRASPSTAAPLWPEIWRQRAGDIAVLVLTLATLSGILVFQDAVAARPRLYRRLRLGFLAFVLLWLGWYEGAQLSVLNVLTFAQALRTEFDWNFFLIEPLIFILWAYVAVALLFWGRGVFCGWLCPFGALQELTSALARRLGFPQRRLPFLLHERLWPIKFILFLGLFALSLGPMALALQLAEVEPFKTAVVLRFDRPWPYVLYALALLVAGLFVERFFCRYLCPLGAALAIPSRLRQFEWLKRRWQCGQSCQICAVNCPVQAIHPEGRINPGECIHCLACQVNYLDDRVCPPLIERRKRKERRATAMAL
jgi:transcriptional regulator of nitric oxide reductase